MNQFDQCIGSLPLPSCPNLGDTLLFIQTYRCYPLSSTGSMAPNLLTHLEDLVDLELSLQLKLQHPNNETTNPAAAIKKKKAGCTCKKTKCLKMYCECFSAGRTCTAECVCVGCSNCDGHNQAAAKAKEMIQVKSSAASKAGGSKGCTCKKSQCRKKYCECFSLGVPCGGDCRCEDCLNGECGKHQKEGRQDIHEQFRLEAQLFPSFVNS